MTKDVLVSIRGLQFQGMNQEDEVITINPGEYYKKNDGHYIVFHEMTDEMELETKNIIKFKKNELNMIKKGLVNTHMVFEEHKKSISNYVTPFGELIFGIDARKVQFRESENQILIEVEYGLEVNDEFLSDCKIVLDIRPKEEAEEF
jgi:uncharacterized beta-barrel protein YwiB (DUF1934 family)